MYCCFKKNTGPPFFFPRTGYTPDSDFKVTQVKVNCVGIFATPVSVTGWFNFHSVSALQTCGSIAIEQSFFSIIQGAFVTRSDHRSSMTDKVNRCHGSALDGQVAFAGEDGISAPLRDKE
jgi:hypothetical protein